MRRVRVPALVLKQVTLMRRRASRCGHVTGRTLILKPERQMSLYNAGSFEVATFVVCRACGQEFPVCHAPLPQCRGHK